MRFTTALLAFSVSGTLAAPIDTRTTISSQAACKGYNNGFWDVNQSVFEVTISRPYLGGARADEIKSKINSKFHVSNMRISGDSHNKNTKITLSSNMDASNLANINKGLKAAYPEITFFCPTTL